MVVAPCCAVDLILPVGIGIAQGCHGSLLTGITLVKLGSEGTILITVHHVDELLLHTHGYATIV